MPAVVRIHDTGTRMHFVPNSRPGAGRHLCICIRGNGNSDIQQHQLRFGWHHTITRRQQVVKGGGGAIHRKKEILVAALSHPIIAGPLRTQHPPAKHLEPQLKHIQDIGPQHGEPPGAPRRTSPAVMQHGAAAQWRSCVRYGVGAKSRSKRRSRRGVAGAGGGTGFSLGDGGGGGGSTRTGSFVGHVCAPPRTCARARAMPSISPSRRVRGLRHRRRTVHRPTTARGRSAVPPPEVCGPQNAGLDSA